MNMSAQVLDGTPAQAGVGTTLMRAVGMEWTKLRSVRSTGYSLTVFVVVSLGISALITWLNARNWHSLSLDQRTAYRADPVGAMLGSGFFLGQLAICVLGVLVITSEY